MEALGGARCGAHRRGRPRGVQLKHQQLKLEQRGRPGQLLVVGNRLGVQFDVRRGGEGTADGLPA